MDNNLTITHLSWQCKRSWKISAKNTAWCLFGCSIGDNLTLLVFQRYLPDTPMLLVMLTAIMMALATSIILETIILLKQLPVREAINIASNMSFISMVVMELTANLTTLLFTGGDSLTLTWYSLVPSMLAGFLSAWPYNYYKIKKYGKSCH